MGELQEFKLEIVMDKDEALKAIEMYKKAMVRNSWKWYPPEGDRPSQEEVDAAIRSIEETARRRGDE